MNGSPAAHRLLSVLLAMLLCHPAAARGEVRTSAPCSAAAVASLGSGGVPDYPGFEVVPAARPAAATVLIDGALTELFLYPAQARDGGGRLIAADARSGAVVWDSGQAVDGELPAAIGHAPAVLADARGLAYRAYFGDGAGGVWRLDLPPGGAAAWRLNRLADLRGLATDAGTVAIPVEPDLFRAVDGAGRPFDGLVLSALVAADNGQRVDLVLLRDYAVDGTGLEETLDRSDLAAVRSCDKADCPPDTGPGWYLADAAPGNALAVAPLIDGGRIFLATHERLSRDCDSGSAERFVVIVDLASASPLYTTTEGDAFALGRQVLDGPRPADGRIYAPGLAEALGAAGLAEGVLDAQGLVVQRRYWLDLLLDAD